MTNLPEFLAATLATEYQECLKHVKDPNTSSDYLFWWSGRRCEIETLAARLAEQGIVIQLTPSAPRRPR
jgi:hypothetical protein